MGLDVDTWEVDHAAIARLPGTVPSSGPTRAGRTSPPLAGSGRGGRSLVLSRTSTSSRRPPGALDARPWAASRRRPHVGPRRRRHEERDRRDGLRRPRAARRRRRLRGDLSLVTVIEEECTGNGALSALDRGYTADAAIIPEPLGRTALEAQVGVTWARIAVHGQGAHAERASAAQNAVVKAARVIDGCASSRPAPTRARPAAAVRRPRAPAQLQRRRHPRRRLDLVGSGGVPLEVRLGLFPGEDMRASPGRVPRRSCSPSWREIPGSPGIPRGDVLRVPGRWLRRPPRHADRRSARPHPPRADGRGARAALVHGHHDARFFNLFYDTPCTCYGAVGGNLHAPDEWVDLEASARSRRCWR